MKDLKSYLGRVRDAVLNRDDLTEFEGGIPYRIGPGSEDAWPRAQLQVHWHPPLAVARETEPIEPVNRLRSWIERHSFWRKSA